MRSDVTKLAIDLESADSASDIISQEEEHQNHTITVGSLLNKKETIGGGDTTMSTEWNDPWSSDAWNDVPAWAEGTFGNAAATKGHVLNAVDTSFDSLQFTPLLKTKGETNDLIDMTDTFGTPFCPTSNTVPTSKAFMKKSRSESARTGVAAIPQPMKSKEKILTKVKVVLKERLSILFADDKDPLCRVVGSISFQPPKRKLNSFCLTVRDKKSHIEHWDEQHSRCRNITASLPHLALDADDQVFSVSLKNRDPQLITGFEVPIVTYTCISRLRPMPLLLKTKIHRKSDRCRLGIRIRANPQNSYVLENVVILIIVPFELDGENVTMSRQGGVWDDMKRSLVWKIPKLESGEIVDIQAQFRIERGLATASDSLESLKIPVLARCNGDTNFSKIALNTEYNEDGSHPVELEVERSAMILYRKV